MSSIVVIQSREATHWITDAGQYGPDGTLVGITSKVLALPCGAAMAWRGAGGEWPHIVYRGLQARTDWHDVLDKAPLILRILHERALVEGVEAAPPGGWEFELYLAGWDQRQDRPACAWLSSQREPVSCKPLEPFTLRHDPLFVVAPGFPQPVEQVLGFPVTAETFLQIDPARDGLKLIEAQRRAPQRDGMMVAAGRAELTRIDRIGVSRSVLREWPDVIGEPVRP